MRFKKYNDSGELLYFLNKVKKECKPYLKLLSGRTPLYRSMNRIIVNMGQKNVRKNRIPMGTPSNVFPKINKWLQENGHVRRDRCVIARSEKNYLFGRPYIIFPISRINYTWVSAVDWNEDDVSGWNPYTLEDYFIHPNKETERFLKTHITTNKGFNIVYNKAYEIWFDCDKYYYMDYELWEINEDFIIKELK